MGEPTRRLPVVYNLLKNRDAAVRSRAAEQLRQIVQLSSGDMNPSQFSDLFAGVQTHLTLMIQGRVKDERLGAITAIDRLIDRPSPDPPNRRDMVESACWKPSKTRACIWVAIPGPVSETLIKTSSSLRDELTVTLPFAVNFSPLPMMLTRI